MSEEITTVQEDVITEEPVGQEELPTALPELECGYVVGLKKENNELVFQLLGDKPSLTHLLGLHQFAAHRIEVAKDLNQSYGTPVVMQQLQQMQQVLQVVLNMLTQQAKGSIITP